MSCHSTPVCFAVRPGVCDPIKPQRKVARAGEVCSFSRNEAFREGPYFSSGACVMSLLFFSLHNFFFSLHFFHFFFQSTDQVTAFCRSLHDMNLSEFAPAGTPDSAPLPPAATPRQLSDADKLRKVVCELVETERTYVKVSTAAGTSCAAE